MKNKARVEGSICSSYLHNETTHFCSHYFNNFCIFLFSSLFKQRTIACLYFFFIDNFPSKCNELHILYPYVITYKFILHIDLLVCNYI